MGVVTGYIMYYSQERKPNVKSGLVFIGWTMSLGFLGSHIFYPLTSDSVIYESVYRELWAASLCWIIFACHQLNSGGILRFFLSSTLWQPLSRIWLSVYVVSYVYIDLSHLNQKSGWSNFSWLLYIVDVLVSFLLGLIFYLFIEGPSIRLSQVVLKREDHLYARI